MKTKIPFPRTIPQDTYWCAVNYLLVNSTILCLLVDRITMVDGMNAPA